MKEALDVFCNHPILSTRQQIDIHSPDQEEEAQEAQEEDDDVQARSRRVDTVGTKTADDSGERA